MSSKLDMVLLIIIQKYNFLEVNKKAHAYAVNAFHIIFRNVLLHTANKYSHNKNHSRTSPTDMTFTHFQPSMATPSTGAGLPSIYKREFVEGWNTTSTCVNQSMNLDPGYKDLRE